MDTQVRKSLYIPTFFKRRPSLGLRGGTSAVVKFTVYKHITRIGNFIKCFLLGMASTKILKTNSFQPLKNVILLTKTEIPMKSSYFWLIKWHFLSSLNTLFLKILVLAMSGTIKRKDFMKLPICIMSLNSGLDER